MYEKGPVRLSLFGEMASVAEVLAFDFAASDSARALRFDHRDPQAVLAA